MTPADAPTHSTPRRRPWLPACGMTVAIAAALLVIAGLILYSLYHAAPAGYLAALAQRDRVPRMQRYAVAESLENRVSAEISFSNSLDDHGRPLPETSATRRILLTDAQINDWLDQRLPLWMKNRGIETPAQLSDPAYWVRDGRAMLGARVRADGFDRVVTCALRIDVPADRGDATVTLDGVWIGRVPVPPGVIRGLLDGADGELGRLIDGISFSPVQNIGGQAARWIAIDPVEEGLLVEIRKE